VIGTPKTAELAEFYGKGLELGARPAADEEATP